LFFISTAFLLIKKLSIAASTRSLGLSLKGFLQMQVAELVNYGPENDAFHQL